MFNSILPKVIQPKNVVFRNPGFMTLQFGEDQEDLVVSIAKGAANYLYKSLDLKESTSKEVFKKSADLWIQLVDLCEERSKDSRCNFYLNKDTNIFFVTDTGELIDMYDCISYETLESIKNIYETFKLDLTERTKTSKMFQDGKDGLIKILIYSSDYNIDDPYTPVVIVEADVIKSKYTVYTGIYNFKNYLLIPDLDICQSYKQYTEFICGFSIDNLLERAVDRSKDLYEMYLTFKENPVEISARELLSLFDKVGYKLSLNNDSDIGDIKAIEENENNEKIQNFFNTFKFTTGETAVDILRLSEFQKIFRYNSLTFLDVLEILSNEYIKYEGAKITAEILSHIVFVLQCKTDDKQQVELIKREIN